MHDGGRALPQCCFNDGPHFQRSGDVETVLFQCITLITFGILDQTSLNFSGQSPQWLRMVCAKLHVKRLRIDWNINEKRSTGVVTTLALYFWNTRSNLTKFLEQSPQWLRMVCAKLHVKRLRIDWDINEKRSADVVTMLAQCFAFITFEVLNQTPPNLLGSCRSSSRWYLQNYIKNGWELTSELTSKWIYILKYSSKFHTNLINNFWSTRSNSTEFTGQWP